MQRITAPFFRKLSPWLICGLLNACASPLALPVSSSETRPQAEFLLRLPPHTLGRSLVAQQRLEIHLKDQPQQTLETLLEINSLSLRLAIIGFNTTLAHLEWDGTRIVESRAAWLPSHIKAERILSDLQMVMWPEPAVRQALPPEWHLKSHSNTRSLWLANEEVARVSYLSPSHTELQNFSENYRINIHSHEIIP